METFIAFEYVSWHCNVVVDPSTMVTFLCNAVTFKTGRRSDFFLVVHELCFDMISSDRGTYHGSQTLLC